jgi:DNA-directed RNA polymerase specialized sigma24 family protein
MAGWSSITPGTSFGDCNERFVDFWRINLVAISRSDETDAWLARHRAPLVGYVLPLVNGGLQAGEDVVQETMLRGWQHSTELEPDKAGPWLHTVARNIAISAYHRRRRTRPAEVPLDAGAAAPTGAGLSWHQPERPGRGAIAGLLLELNSAAGGGGHLCTHRPELSAAQV